MPPGPAFNWFCVLYSAADILSHTARIRASQLSPTTSHVARKRRRLEQPSVAENEHLKAYGDSPVTSNTEQARALKKEDPHDIFAAPAAFPQPTVVQSAVISPHLVSENPNTYHSPVPEAAHHEEEPHIPLPLRNASPSMATTPSDKSVHQVIIFSI